MRQARVAMDSAACSCDRNVGFPGHHQSPAPVMGGATKASGPRAATKSESSALGSAAYSRPASPRRSRIQCAQAAAHNQGSGQGLGQSCAHEQRVQRARTQCAPNLVRAACRCVLGFGVRSHGDMDAREHPADCSW